MKRRWYYDDDSIGYAWILALSIYTLLTLFRICVFHTHLWWAFLLSAGISGLFGAIFSSRFGRVFTGWFFRKRFGFKPSRLAGIKDIEQRMVNQVLHNLAIEMDNAFKEQTAVYNQPIGNSITVEDHKKREEKLRELDRTIKQAKEAFWNSHFLTKDRGFFVKDKYSDYLKQV